MNWLQKLYILSRNLIWRTSNGEQACSWDYCTCNTLKVFNFSKSYQLPSCIIANAKFFKFSLYKNVLILLLKHSNSRSLDGHTHVGNLSAIWGLLYLPSLKFKHCTTSLSLNTKHWMIMVILQSTFQRKSLLEITLKINNNGKHL